MQDMINSYAVSEYLVYPSFFDNILVLFVSKITSDVLLFIFYNKMSIPLRFRVRNLYKTFLHYSKDWPGKGGQEEFKTKLKLSFLKNKDLKEPKEIEEAIARGEYVIKEIDALYRLKKYRAMFRNYYQDR